MTTTTAKATFRAARSLYRQGLREPASVRDERLTRSGRNSQALYSIRPKCDRAVAMVAGIDDRAPAYLGPNVQMRVVSLPRYHYEHQRGANITSCPYMADLPRYQAEAERYAIRELGSSLHRAQRKRNAFNPLMWTRIPCN